jgi:hypothetical protein
MTGEGNPCQKFLKTVPKTSRARMREKCDDRVVGRSA